MWEETVNAEALSQECALCGEMAGSECGGLIGGEEGGASSHRGEGSVGATGKELACYVRDLYSSSINMPNIRCNSFLTSR